MPINNTNIIYKNVKLDRILNHFVVTDKVIEDVNSILSVENFDEVLSKIEKFKENWKRIYEKYWNSIESKQKILDFIFNNISKLLNNLEIVKVHNSTSTLHAEEFNSLDDIKLFKKMFRIKWQLLDDVIITWASCHNYILFIKKIINYISSNDSDIKYEYQINKDNHWLMYIIIWSKKYVFDSPARKFFLEEIELWKIKGKSRNKPKLFNDFDTYKEAFTRKANENNMLAYHFWTIDIKILKKWGFVSIFFRNKPLNYIDVHWLKSITTKISQFSSIKYFWLLPKLSNLNEIYDFIIWKVWKQNKENASLILPRFDDKKLLDIFNIK